MSDNIDDENHIIAANEGNAVSLAVGHFLGSGKPGFVYMQNSGIGNAINPLLSLADGEVYGVPMLLMVGWRGEPGVKDEPQHVKQGRVMPELLNALEVPWFILGADEDYKTIIHQAISIMKERMTPVVLLVKKGFFSDYKSKPGLLTQHDMSREVAIKHVVDCLDSNDYIVSTTGMASRELYEYRNFLGAGCNNDFLTVGSMGHASSIAMALAARQRNKRIICLDGDGSIIMHMGSLALIGQMGTPNFIHIVINNGAHDSVGGQKTVALKLSLAKLASDCGYNKVKSLSRPNELIKFMKSLPTIEGPVFLEVMVNIGARSNLGRPKTSPIENRQAFMFQMGIK